MPFNIALHILDTLPSTNLYAINQIRTNLAHDGIAYMASQQTAGRGRHTNIWEAQKGQSITLSLVLNMHNKPITPSFSLSMAIALACTNFLKTFNVPVNIKWPNDILINRQKCGGILIENLWQGQQWQWAVVGIGLNINQQRFSANLNQATSLLKYTKAMQPYNTVALAQQLLAEIKKTLQLLLTDCEEVYSQYNLNICNHLKTIKYTHQNTLKKGKLIAVNPNGSILINNLGSKLFNIDDIKIAY